MNTTALISLEQYEIMIEAGAFAGANRQHVELIRGEIRMMSPIGNRHELMVNTFMDWCYKHWPRDQFMIRCQSSLLIPQSDSVPQPDIAIVTRKKYKRHPMAEDVHLLIEVSDSTVATDLGDKLALYAEGEIEEYWVVNIPSRVIHVYHTPRDGEYQEVATYRGEDSIQVAKRPDAIASPASLFDILD